MRKTAESGFGVFAYILMAVGLLAALAAAITLSGRTNSRAQQNDILAAKLYAQASKIRSDILLCMAEQNTLSGVGPTVYQRYPSCSGSLDSTPTAVASYTDPMYCTNVSTNSEIYANARTLRCLAPAANSVWDNADGNFFPDPIPGWEEWKYSITTDTNLVGGESFRGVAITISTDGDGNSWPTNEDTSWVLNKVKSRFGANEAILYQRTGQGMDPGNFEELATPAEQANTFRLWIAR